jgi:hypothetical protein
MIVGEGVQGSRALSCPGSAERTLRTSSIPISPSVVTSAHILRILGSAGEDVFGHRVTEFLTVSLL